MNFVSVNDMLVNIAQIVRKCPTPTLQRAYTRAFREWCQQTQWLRTNIPGLAVADQRQYSLGNDPQLDIMGIFWMQGSFTPATGITQYWTIGPSNSDTWNANLTPGQPVRYAYIPEAQFALDPIPQQEYNLNVTVILAPVEGAINVPQAPLIKYSNDIESGALAYLLSLPGMPWTDKVSAAVRMKEFNAAISNGKAEAQRAYNTGAQRAAPRAFFLGNGRGR